MSDIFKMVEFFFNYVIGQRQSIGSRSQEISVEILNQIRRVLILVVITLGALTIFCMGVSHLIERVLNNLDQGTAFFTPSVWVILGFLLVCIATLVYSTNKNVWLSIFKKEKLEEAEHKSSGVFGGGQLESVISLLVLDILKEREAGREREKNRENHKENHHS